MTIRQMLTNIPKEQKNVDDLHRVIFSNEAPLLSGPVDLVAHDGPAEVVAVRAVGKWVEGENGVRNLARHVPEF